MDFVILANAWSAARDNPTSKHQIALELARQGHRVLWVEGAGMRRPKMGSARDRSRAWRKVVGAWRGPERSEVRSQRSEIGGQRSEEERSMLNEIGDQQAEGSDRMSDSSANLQSSIFNLQSICVLSPLTIPLPAQAWARRFNGWLVTHLARKWARRLGFQDPVLINYVPVFAEVMRRWGERGRHGASTFAPSTQRRASADKWRIHLRQGFGGQVAHGEGKSHEVFSNKEPGTASGAMPHAPCSMRLYHCVDRWDSFGTYDRDLMASLDAECCRQADVVVASSTDLYERCKGYNANTYLMTHGVDYQHFAKALELEIRGQRPEVTVATSDRSNNLQSSIFNLQSPIVGFFGLISEWVDQDLLVRLAREVPQVQVVLIGKADVSTDRLSAEKNIHLLGPRVFAELPVYAAGFAVGIIPFTVNELTRAVNPIKLQEMLAAGCPVVSTDLPEARAVADTVNETVRNRQPGFPWAVAVARNADEFVACVKECLERRTEVDDRRAISDSVKNETWECKVIEILKLVKNTKMDR